MGSSLWAANERLVAWDMMRLAASNRLRLELTSGLTSQRPPCTSDMPFPIITQVRRTATRVECELKLGGTERTSPGSGGLPAQSFYSIFQMLVVTPANAPQLWGATHSVRDTGLNEADVRYFTWEVVQGQGRR